MMTHSTIQLLAYALTETSRMVSVEYVANLAGEPEEKVVKALKKQPEFGFITGFLVDENGMIERCVESRSARAEEVKQVFEYWVQKTNRAKQTKMTADRTAKIRSRLKEGYSVSDLCRAVDGIMLSDFHNGANEHGRVYTDCEVVFRNAQKVDHFMSLAPNAPAEPVKRTAEFSSQFEEPL